MSLGKKLWLRKEEPSVYCQVCGMTFRAETEKQLPEVCLYKEDFSDCDIRLKIKTILPDQEYPDKPLPDAPRLADLL